MGVDMREQITYLDEYYLTNYEIEVLEKSAVELAARIPAGAMVIELGSGFVAFSFSYHFHLNIIFFCYQT